MEVTRNGVGRALRSLRKERRWSQRMLAEHLGTSQPRLSLVEAGNGSLTAEEFLSVLQLFNVGPELFLPRPQSSVGAVQNALARHGAAHLAEDAVVVPAELTEPADVVLRVLLAPESSRHITALAPVLYANADRIRLAGLYGELSRHGRHQRLLWLLACIREALLDHKPKKGAELRRWRRFVRDIDLFNLDRPRPAVDSPLDVLDPAINTAAQARRVYDKKAGPLAREWRVVTTLTPPDFLEALEAARELH